MYKTKLDTFYNRDGTQKYGTKRSNRYKVEFYNVHRII